MPKSRIVREKSQNGEVHLIIRESMFDDNEKAEKDLDETELRKIMKKEASKPLLLLREE